MYNLMGLLQLNRLRTSLALPAPRSLARQVSAVLNHNRGERKQKTWKRELNAIHTDLYDYVGQRSEREKEGRIYHNMDLSAINARTAQMYDNV
jgi:hypothetical protein